MLAGMRRLLRLDILISVYYSTIHTAGILRRLQTRGDQHSSWVDFNTSAQQQQLSDGKFGDRINAWIIQSTIANAADVIERDK